MIEVLKQALEVNESMKDVLKQVNELIAENKSLKQALAQLALDAKAENARSLGLDYEQEPTSELHSCPYAEEIHGNYEKVCDCDEERTRQCAQDI
jgi:hypothetical protein